MNQILLKNGEVVTDRGVQKVDILIGNGKIVNVAQGIHSKEKIEIVDCSGKTILPGLIDVHVHFRQPGEEYKENFETGSRAAASGGVTTVFDMPNNKPPILTVKDLEKKRALIKGKSYVNYGLYIACNGKNIDEVNSAKNVAGVKVYCAGKDELSVSEKDLENIFKKMDKKKLLVFHAEDPKCIEQREKEYLVEFGGRDVNPAIHSKIRAPECALSMVKKLCALVKKYPRPIHFCHVSTEAELEVIAEHKKYGVTCEVAPQYLVLSDSDYEYLGNFIKMNPPVRERLEVFGVWKNLKAGNVDVIASDHAPHERLEKSLEYLNVPSGVPGVETTLPIFLNSVNDEGLSIEEVVRMCCTRPAEIFGVRNKGKIEEGFDADLVVVDMEKDRELQDKDIVSKCGWSPYFGSTFKGWPVMTFVDGEMVFKDGESVGVKHGKEIEFS